MLLALLMSASGRCSPTESELELKAVFVANFIRFTEFSEAAKKSSRLLCSDTSEMWLYLKAMDGMEIDGQNVLKVETFSKSTAPLCDILYASSGEVYRSMLEVAERNKKALTIGDNVKGVMISLYVEDDKVKFRINSAIAGAVGVRFRSQLLEVASEIINGNEEN